MNPVRKPRTTLVGDEMVFVITTFNSGHPCDRIAVSDDRVVFLTVNEYEQLNETDITETKLGALLLKVTHE